MNKFASPVGIFGGTFDPVHFGHLRLAQEIAEHCSMEKVRILPAGIPPHRNQPHCDPAHRFEMLRIACKGNPVLEPDPLEVEKDSPCYSVESLERIREDCGKKTPLCLMVGADAFLGLASWHRWQEIFRFAHVVVATRPGFHLASGICEPLAREFRERLASGPEELGASAFGRILPVEITLLDISSSRIRECFESGRSARYLLPDGVLDYIGKNGLYRNRNGC